MSAYYNEIDPYAAQWLRNLIAAGEIASGDVDERSIVDVKPDDLTGYTQCHFFAGIGGWSLAARLAGWPDDRPLWTGSCPCQPFSVAGRGKGIKDERHLWPDFYRLIRGSRPAVVMGEQVAGTAGYAWLDGVLADMEAEAYAGRAVDIPACSVNAPQIRSRLYWVASAAGESEREPQHSFGAEPRKDSRIDAGGSGWRSGAINGMGRASSSERRADAKGRLNVDDGPDTGRQEAASGSELASAAVGGMDSTTGARCWEAERGTSRAIRDGARRAELERRSGGGGADGVGRTDSERDADSGRGANLKAPCRVQGSDGQRERIWVDARESSHTAGFWDDWQLIGPDPDGKYRRIKPGITPLDTRLPGHVGQIRGYGNAICPELAAEVMRAWMESASADRPMSAPKAQED